ncbi:winged helix-turn-helix domain-containing protein [Tunturiibacter empetritectus]|uniref:Tol biopolymer transport system component/DNA-binding winged helix-turn-helix (WHTH) protein n=1 Tax=Tunturiibacter lichenicola TaxID=2051959 RepID=A0A852V8L8_9BACT|nr:winged helix-turn-helix domain-containing protein [Edaphobacter lichenicola]NYF88050.1 Tol biopolymer transport system component/DNA-binding winged helix-turn-helix (wHTH) protein [Edaphobacter lichenicola]
MADRAEGPGSIRFAPFELVLEPEELRRNGIRVKVSGQALQVLIVLASERGRLVTREHLHKVLWPATSFGDFEHGLNAAVNRLREILGDSAINPKYIETIPRQGYRFIAANKVEDEQVPPLPPIASTEPPRPPAKLPSRRWWIVLAVAACILISLACIRLKARLEEASRLLRIQRLTVVPFTSLPGNVTSPAFSPDGSEVAFGWDGETNGAGYDLYVKAIGSENPLRITHHPSEKLSIAWSPDGRAIAISRVSKEGASGIFLVPPTGGPERKISSRSSTYWYGNELSWSPDGKYLAFTDHPETSYQSIMLYLLSMSTLKATPVTKDCKEAVLPSFSPKGELMAWVCADKWGSESLRLLNVGDGSTTELLKVHEMIGGVAWSRDGDSILYSSPLIGGGLWEVVLTHPERAQRLPIGHDVSDLTVSSSGRRLVYLQSSTNTNIWRLDLEASPAQAHKLIVSSAEQESASISPDGRRIAFESDRSGAIEIWVCDVDGSNVLQLTSFGVMSGTPRWSPDGGLIAFDSRFGGESNLYTVDPEGGVPAKLNIDIPDKSQPGWSPDGKWIYFTQGDDTGEPSIWKAPSQGGHAVQLASVPAATPLASPDGQYVYFFRKKRLWRMLPDGSSPEELKGMPELSFQGAEWFPSKAGIYFMTHENGKTTIELFDTGTQKVRPVFSLENASPYWIGAMPVSPDGKWMLFPQVDGHSSNLMMIENMQ